VKLGPTITAVVTGGASGLGAATVRRLAAAGVRVAIFDLDEANGMALAAQTGALFCRVDVCSDAEVDAALAIARARVGQERILVNCAGAAIAFRTASRDRATGEPVHFPIAAFERIVQLNLVATFRCMAKSAAGMLALAPLDDGERGVIINTSSIAAEDGQVGQAAYASSKAGVAGLTLTAARDLMDEGIRVNAILPGIFDTPMLQAGPQHVQAALTAAIPFPKRAGDPAEFAALVAFIAATTYFNGECVRLDGAFRMPSR
jgi:NAD(P)-dependent dehydrogenase (short-subunit alcohol dehydrogenase family)